MERYLLIYKKLKDMRWHKKKEFCRAFSDDTRRLREMAENGWIKYIVRTIQSHGKVLFSEYKIISVSKKWQKIVDKQNNKQLVIPI